LKPEICSRRNRSAIPQSGRHECLHFTERPYFVSTLGLEPEPFLTVAGRFVIGRWQEAYARRRGSATDSFNWHVQPICQRPIRFPPERRAFSPEQITHGCGPVCPRNLLKLQLSSYNCQPEGITRLPQLLHSCEDSTQGERMRFSTRDERRLPQGRESIPARAEAEAHKLEKRSLGGSCE
jgi:hypothetical protein